MNEIKIKLVVEAPELCAALNNAANAILALPTRSFAPVAAVPAVGDVTPAAPEMPVAATAEAVSAVPDAVPAPAAVETPTPAPAVAPTPTPTPSAPTAAPASAGPVESAPTNAPAAAESPSKAYTFEDIKSAGGQLMQAGKMAELSELLKSFGVQAVTQLKPDQYGGVMQGLIELGAKV